MSNPINGFTIVVGGVSGLASEQVFDSLDGFRAWVKAGGAIGYNEQLSLVATGHVPPGVPDGEHVTVSMDETSGTLAVGSGRVMLAAIGVSSLQVFDQLIATYLHSFTPADIVVQLLGTTRRQFGSIFELEQWLTDDGRATLYESITCTVPTVMASGDYSATLHTTGCTFTVESNQARFTATGMSTLGVLNAALRLHQHLVKPAVVKLHCDGLTGDKQFTALHVLETWLRSWEGRNAGIFEIEYIADGRPNVDIRQEFRSPAHGVLTERNGTLTIFCTGADPRTMLYDALEWRDTVNLPNEAGCGDDSDDSDEQ